MDFVIKKNDNALYSWKLISFSSNGSQIVAMVAKTSKVITISRDGGATWSNPNSIKDKQGNELKSSGSWNSIASSADGLKIAAVMGPYSYARSDGGIYTSTDYGSSWTKTSPAVGSEKKDWKSISSSSDGLKLVVVASESSSLGDKIGVIYISTNGGANWKQVL